jgi:hypothetical protein
MADEYTITVRARDVAEGDATDLAQTIWDEHAEAFDAANGDFTVTVSKDGFDIDWEPES